MHLAAAPATPSSFSASLAAFDALGPFEPAPHLAVAVSGGSDSMALALMAHDWAQARGGQITVLTIDHGLRPESAQEVQQVAQWMASHGIACEIMRIEVPREGNLQAHARDARYEALTTWCRTHNVLHLCLGHHRDDQAETIALHRARGATADGDSGMAAVSLRQGVRLLRPLLGHSKHWLQTQLYLRGQSWLEDPSNTSDAYARNRLRGTLSSKNLLAVATHKGLLRAQREYHFAREVAPIVQLYTEGYATMTLAAFRALPEAQASLLLANLLRTLSGAPSRPRAHETKRMLRMLRLLPKAVTTLAGYRMEHDGITASFVRESGRIRSHFFLPASGHMRYDGRFDLHWQNIPPAAFISSLGHLPRRKREQLAPHLPKAVMETLPALQGVADVLCVPHIGYAHPSMPADARFSVTFSPAKPLAASPFWCLNASETV